MNRRATIIRRSSIVVALTLASCTGRYAVSPKAEHERERVKVLMIGDSITFGQSSEPLGPGYVELVAARLGVRFEIINVGCGGAFALQWKPGTGTVRCLGRDITVNLFDHFVVQNAPVEYATVMLGTNDAEIRRLPRTYRNDLLELIHGLLGVGVTTVVLISPPPHQADEAARILALAYARVIFDPVHGVCATTPAVVCGPDTTHLLEPEVDLAPRDVHPNATGHAKIAKALAATLQRIANTSHP